MKMEVTCTGMLPTIQAEMWIFSFTSIINGANPLPPVDLRGLTVKGIHDGDPVEFALMWSEIGGLYVRYWRVIDRWYSISSFQSR